MSTYTLDELDDLNWWAREKAIEAVGRFSDESFSDSVDFIIDERKEMLEKLGYTDPEIHYNLSFDGCDWAAIDSGIDVRQWLKARKLGNKMRTILEAAPYIYMYVNSDIRGNCRVAYNCDWSCMTDRAADTMGEFAEMVTGDVEDRCHEIKRALLNEYHWMTSEEYIVDMIEANEYRFYEDGRLA